MPENIRVVETSATMTTEGLPIQRLNREHLPIQTVKMARYLIGKTLVHDLPRVRLVGRIVETEAYVRGDAASHAFRGLTARNRTLFLERGHVYVYFIYGNHFMLNISGQREGIGEGVLLRAIEPLEGIEQMKRYRGTGRLLDLARGPGRLAEAFGISRRLASSSTLIIRRRRSASSRSRRYCRPNGPSGWSIATPRRSATTIWHGPTW